MKPNQNTKLSGGGARPFAEPHPESLTDPWNLLSKAENWRKLGFQTGAVVAADEAVQAQLRKSFDKLGLPKPDNLEEALCYLRKNGAEISVRRMLKLRKIRERAEASIEDDLSQSEVDEAVTIAEESISLIGEEQELVRGAFASSGCCSRSSSGTTSHSRKGAEEDRSFSAPTADPFDLMESISANRGEAVQIDTDFVTKLLLARAILNYKKKRVPHLAGLIVVFALLVPSIFFGLFGVSSIVLMLTGHSVFSIIRFLLDLFFLFLAYTSLKVALLVRRQTQ